MHYKNGREAKLGDQVVMRDAHGNMAAGYLVKAIPGADTCNGQLVPFNTPIHYVTLGDCLHIDDAVPKEVPSGK